MKQRITLVVLAVLFVAASSFAQGKATRFPLSQKHIQAISLQAGKDSKQQPAKALQQKQQNMDWQKGFRAAAAAHNKLTGKNMVKKPIALRRGPADIISEQPEGTKKVYSRNGSAYYSSMFGVYSSDYKSAVGTVVFGADNKVYIKDIVTQAKTGAWIEGTISGSTITIQLPQTVYAFVDEGYNFEVSRVTYDPEQQWFVKSADQTVTLDYNAETGVITTSGKLNTGEDLIGLTYDDDNSWSGYGDWNMTFSVVTDALVEAPAGLKTETYSLTAEGYTGSLLNVGFDGNDVYVQGIDANLPETWIKGTLDGNKVTFKNGQYVGADEVSGYHEYLMSATAKEFYEPALDYKYYEYTLSDADITFDYDATTKTLSNNTLFLLNAGTTDAYSYTVFDKVIIAPFTEVAATPAAPTIELSENDYEYFAYGYGWGAVYIDMKTCDVNGNYTLPEKTSYKLWVKVNGEVKPLSFSYYDYVQQTEPVLTEIPFDYTDGWDIGDTESQKYIYYYVIGPEAYGVQTIYRGGGEEHASEITWAEVTGIGAEIQPAAATPAYPEATIGDNDNKIGYGFYTGEEDVNVTTNNRKPETYDVAVKFNDPALVGTLIESITFPLQEVEGVSDISVFLTSQLRVENGKNAADLVVKSVEPAEPGFITVKLDKPYTIPEGGVYVGYSLTVNSVENAANAAPVAVTTQYNDGGLYLHTSDGFLKWMDFGQYIGASAMIQIKVAGSNVKGNAVAIAPSNAQFVKTGEAITLPLTVINHGAKGIQSMDVTYSVAGQTGSQHFDTAVDGFFGKSATFNLNIPAIAEKGNYELALNVSKVNGIDNEDAATATTIPVVALNTVPKKRTLLEEYTGFWCGWCPRGYVGLEKLAELYPDDYVLVSYHNGDELEIMNSNSFPSAVSGFPAAWMDRATELDAYYGTGNNEFGIADDLAANNQLFGQADINITPTLNDDETAVDIATEVIFPYDLTDGDYTVEYILTSDGLTDATWGQSNYYAGGGSGYPKYMDQFSNGESKVYGLVFNDVAVLTSEMLDGSDNSIATATADVPVKFSYSFRLGNAFNTAYNPVIQNVQNLKVVAILIDATTGKVVNANVAKVGNSTGITINELSQKPAATYFDLQGRRVAKPAKGLYINNGRKVVIK